MAVIADPVLDVTGMLASCCNGIMMLFITVSAGSTLDGDGGRGDVRSFAFRTNGNNAIFQRYLECLIVATQIWR